MDAPDISFDGRPVRVAVIGSGYVGLVAAVCFAEIGHSVICVDNDDAKIVSLQSGHIPIHENLLPELLERHRNSRLSFTTDLPNAVRGSEVVVIAVGTPPLENGDTDLSYVQQVASDIAQAIDKYTVIVEKSTVPVYTSDWITNLLMRNGIPRASFEVVSNPEFLREGTAVADFLHADRIVVGTTSDRAFELLDTLYRPLTSGTYFDFASSVPGCRSSASPVPLLRTSAQSAELIKHASNAFLAMKISFINSVANLCESVKADITEVAQGMGMDQRIGPRFLSAGLGYGGSCFPKDVKAFRAIGARMGVDLGLLHEVERINELQQAIFLGKIRSVLWNLDGKRIGVLGLAFKGGTDDVRESPAIHLVRAFLADGAQVTAYDPAAMENARKMFAEDNMTFVQSAYEVMDGADALVVLTDWAEFGQLDLLEIKRRLHSPIVLDGRNLFDAGEMKELGFTYISVGRPACEQPVAETFALAEGR